LESTLKKISFFQTYLESNNQKRDKHGYLYVEWDPKAFNTVVSYITRLGNNFRCPEREVDLLQVIDISNHLGMIDLLCIALKKFAYQKLGSMYQIDSEPERLQLLKIAKEQKWIS